MHGCMLHPNLAAKGGTFFYSPTLLFQYFALLASLSDNEGRKGYIPVTLSPTQTQTQTTNETDTS